MAFLLAIALLATAVVAIMAGIGIGEIGARSSEKAAVAERRLVEAREALLGYALRTLNGARPGQLPAPDHHGDANYDGKENNLDCLDATQPGGLKAISAGVNYRCLGRLPWRTLGLAADGGDQFDVTGVVPWYAVSANLSSSTACFERLNPVTVAAQPVPFACDSNSKSAPPFPWLTVCDADGRVLSDRVAFVVIIPGPPIATTGRMQARAAAPPLRDARDFLDAVPQPAAWSALPADQRCNSFDNAALTNQFIAATPSEGFNDRLSWMTVDDLMARVEQRVAQEVREAISAVGNGERLPWLAPVANPDTMDSHTAAAGMLSGLVPFHSPTTSRHFLSELSWTIATKASSDTLSATATFKCYGGAFTCRLVATPGGSSAPQTITPAEFLQLKTSGVNTASVSCSYKSPTELECDEYTFKQAPRMVSYEVQRQLAGGKFQAVGTYSGELIRHVTIFFTGLSASGGATYAVDANGFTRRTIKTGSGMTGSNLLGAVDKWTPATNGLAPFDQLAAGEIITGRAETGGTGVVTAVVRAYPVLPGWYATQGWHEVIFAAYSADVSPNLAAKHCSTRCLTAGNRTGVDVVVLSAGKMLAGQSRYAGSPGIADFLEGPNVNGPVSGVFADTQSRNTNVYADTLVTLPR